MIFRTIKVVRIIILVSFAVISFNAHSQTIAKQTPAAQQEIIDWLNQKFSLYRLKNPDFPKEKMGMVRFDDCTMQVNGGFVVPDSKIENITINLATINKIDFLPLKGGMIYLSFGDNIVYINFDISQEPDLLNQVKTGIDYLKTYCTNTN